MPIPDSILNKTLTSVTIKGSYVGPYAFYGQTNLSSVSGRNIDIVDSHSFTGCTSLTIDSFPFSGIKYIGYGAFSNCTGLSGSLTLPVVGYIDAEAFRGCTNLTRIELGENICVLDAANAIPDSVTTIAVPAKYVDAYKTYPIGSSFANQIVAR